MKKLILAAMILAAAPAVAAEAPKDHACGKTFDECKKAYDQQTVAIENLSWAVQGLQNQRNEPADAQVRSFVQQQRAAKEAADAEAAKAKK